MRRATKLRFCLAMALTVFGFALSSPRETSAAAAACNNSDCARFCWSLGYSEGICLLGKCHCYKPDLP